MRVDSLRVMTLAQRHRIFRRLVLLQDSGIPVDDAREECGKMFGIVPEVIRNIEQEGLDADWPLPELR